jgi:hypothetical protein
MSMRAQRPAKAGLTASVIHQPGGVSDRRSRRAVKSRCSDDSFTRSSFEKSVPIHEPSIIEGGTRMKATTLGLGVLLICAGCGTSSSKTAPPLDQPK